MNEVQRIYIELRLGNSGLQAGCHAVIVRVGESVTQTPWILGTGDSATHTARAAEKHLRAQSPNALFSKVGYI